MTQTIIISSYLNSDNISFISADSYTNIKLEINKDAYSDFYQWFHYRLQFTAGVEYVMLIMNAANASYIEGWRNYQAVVSYDRNTWFRVDSEYENGELIIRHTPKQANLSMTSTLVGE